MASRQIHPFLLKPHKQKQIAILLVALGPKTAAEPHPLGAPLVHALFPIFGP
jgi:hypothetical protein